MKIHSLHAHYFKKQFEQKELDADGFASELLVPRDLIKVSVENVKAQTLEEATLFSLWVLFDVSIRAPVSFINCFF